MIDLDAAEKLAAEATKGPWIAELDCFDSDEGIVAVVSNAGTDLLFKGWTGILPHQCDGVSWTAEDSAKRDALYAQARGGQELRDARLMSAARLLVPQLVAECRRLTACLATANSNHEEYERRYYLTIDERDALLARLEDRDAVVADIVLRTAETIAAWLDGDAASFEADDTADCKSVHGEFLRGFAVKVRAGKWKP